MAELDPTTLASQRCVAVDAATPPLDHAEVERLATGLDPAWQVGDDRIVRTFRFPNFGAAMTLATRISLLAESQGHHPTLEVAWGRLIVIWTTDAISGLTTNDLVMAAKVDRLLERGLAIRD